jgi:RNA-binding protein YhbY
MLNVNKNFGSLVESIERALDKEKLVGIAVINHCVHQFPQHSRSLVEEVYRLVIEERFYNA